MLVDKKVTLCPIMTPVLSSAKACLYDVGGNAVNNDETIVDTIFQPQASETPRLR